MTVSHNTNQFIKYILILPLFFTFLVPLNPESVNFESFRTPGDNSESYTAALCTLSVILISGLITDKQIFKNFSEKLPLKT